MSIFSSVKGLRVKKNAFNLSHDNQFTCEIGTIVPVYVHHNLLPNSDLKVSTTQLSRFQALLAPIQSRIDCFIHFWKIPYRLLDPLYDNFISGDAMRNNSTYLGKYVTFKDLHTRFKAIISNNLNPSDITSISSYSTIFGPGTLWDMLGYPVYLDNNESEDNFKSTEIKVSAYPIIAYYWLISRRYLNQNFVTTDRMFLDWDYKTFVNTVDFLLSDNLDAQGNVSETICNLLLLSHHLFDNQKGFGLHSYSKDYFTGALPFTQVGDDVTLSLGGEIPVTSSIVSPVGGLHLLAVDNNGVSFENPNLVLRYRTTPPPEGAQLGDIKLENGHLEQYYTYGGETGHRTLDLSAMQGVVQFKDILTGEIVNPNDWVIEGTGDLSQSTAITINELRVANALQSLKESFARFGTRIDEWLLGFWGQKSQDSRLQLPEYIGGGRVPISVSDIEQTSATNNSSVIGGNSPLGTLAGKGTSMGAGFAGFKTHIVEPSIVIGLFFIKPKSMYGNFGLNRHLTKVDDLFDFLNPKTEHLGEQAVYNYELRCDTGQDVPLQTFVFGYQSRYAEYKFMHDEIHGQFLTYLNYWHLGRLFGNIPSLNMEFTQVRPSNQKRPFAVQSVSPSPGTSVDIAPVLNWLHFDVSYIAPMSKFGTPLLLN